MIFGSENSISPSRGWDCQIDRQIFLGKFRLSPSTRSQLATATRVCVFTKVSFKYFSLLLTLRLLNFNFSSTWAKNKHTRTHSRRARKRYVFYHVRTMQECTILQKCAPGVSILAPGPQTLEVLRTPSHRAEPGCQHFFGEITR